MSCVCGRRAAGEHGGTGCQGRGDPWTAAAPGPTGRGQRGAIDGTKAGFLRIRSEKRKETNDVTKTSEALT